MQLLNSPVVKLALVGVSRDCFPIELTRTRLAALGKACTAVGLDIAVCPTIIENERDTMAALAEAEAAGANAAVIYLGNFGPEGPLSIFAQRFAGPVMACAAAEESKTTLVGGRGDAYCGMLNASYNFSLRNLHVYIPQMPVGLPDELALKIQHFAAVAKVLIGIRNVKLFTFGPRPQDFYACNAPIKPLYDLGIEVMENSELDLLTLFNAVSPQDPDVARISAEMAAELGAGNTYPDLLQKLARFELALVRFYEQNLGSRQYGVFADKCWPAFEEAFGFVPCYVNSRMAARGIPVACEVDMYGAISEYMCQLASNQPATLLDINNTVPRDLLSAQDDLHGAAVDDLFMGFHCGNTPSSCMKNCAMKYQLIMNRLLEDPSKQPDITRGTLEGQLRPGPTTFFRLQGNAEGVLRSYVSEGAILDIDPHSFGGIGVFGIPNFARFYRHVLIGKCFPHHGAVAFDHCAEILFDALAMLGVSDISVPLPATTLYPGENPFALAKSLVQA
ncbi:MAG TPA: fucose isomerase [Armatimonadota bacterium]|nr:fucose isomerase [Armatimonadota bacterium]